MKTNNSSSIQAVGKARSMRAFLLYGAVALISLLQVVTVAGLWVLSYYAKYRGGVHRHLYYKKGVYTAAEGILSPKLAGIYALLVVVVTIAILMFAAYCNYRTRKSTKKSRLFSFSFWVTLLSAGAFVFVAISKYGQALLSYPYYTAAIAFIWGLSILNLMIVRKH